MPPRKASGFAQHTRRSLLLVALLLQPAAAADAPAVQPPSPKAPQAGEDDAAAAMAAPNTEHVLLRGLRRAVGPPLKLFAEAPPITRSWVSASVFMAVLTSGGAVDLKRICFSERGVLQNGEWWRLVTNFFYMGDSFKSIFFWMQIYHFWECLKVLELVKYRWEPADFVKMITGNAAMLLLLKQLFPQMIFLGSPMVMAFVYMYSREYEQQVMNLLGFFQIRCGWLPLAQMLQDLLQAGDIGPNLLGLVSGHTYFYGAEVAPRLLLPERVGLDDVLRAARSGRSLFEDEAAELAAAEIEAGAAEAAEQEEEQQEVEEEEEEERGEEADEQEEQEEEPEDDDDDEDEDEDEDEDGDIYE